MDKIEKYLKSNGFDFCKRTAKGSDIYEKKNIKIYIGNKAMKFKNTEEKFVIDLGIAEEVNEDAKLNILKENLARFLDGSLYIEYLVRTQAMAMACDNIERRKSI